MTSEMKAVLLKERIVALDAEVEIIRLAYEEEARLRAEEVRVKVAPLLKQRLALVTEFHSEVLKAQGLEIGDVLAVTPEFLDVLRKAGYANRNVMFFARAKTVRIEYYGGGENLIVRAGGKGSGDVPITLAQRMKAAHQGVQKQWISE